MKAMLFVAAILAASALAAPATAQRYSDPQDSRAQASSGERVAPASHDSAAIAEDLRVHGRCDKAVPMLRRVVERGSGYQISQYDLGECLFDLAKAEPDAKKAADMREEAASWIVRAADGGFNKAQASAVLLFLDGTGVAPDPVEAEKWALLYHSNGIRLALGLPDVSPDVRDRLDGALTDANRREAQSRADAWTPPQLDQ